MAQLVGIWEQIRKC